MSCKYLENLLSEERNLIKRHLEEYKKNKKIEDFTEAKINFIKDYGWIIREVFCDLCLEKNCKEYKVFLENKGLYQSSFYSPDTKT